MFSLIRSGDSKLIFLTAIEMTFAKIITLKWKKIHKSNIYFNRFQLLNVF